MPHRRRHSRLATTQHRHMLLAALYLAGALLVFNAWLVTQ